MTIKITMKAIFLLVMFFAGAAYAVPPTNDSFANPITLSGASGNIQTTNVDATRESGEPIHALNRGGTSVWFKHIATGNGVLRFSTQGSGFNTLIGVYTGSTLSNLKLIASNDDIAVLNDFSVVTIGTEMGRTYYIAVDGNFDEFTGAAAGSVNLTWAFSTVHAGDNFSQPASLALWTRNQVWASNVGASKEPGEPNHANNAGGRSIWYKWTVTPGMTRSYTFTTKGSVRAAGGGVPMSTLLAVYRGTSIDGLSLVAQASGRDPKVTFTPTPSEVLYIAVDGYNEGQEADIGTIALTFGPTDSTKDSDFDLDGRADVTVYRPSDGTWYTLDSITGTMRAARWGASGDKAIPGRYDNDDKLDYSVFRPDTSTWWTYGSSAGSSAALWGLGSDIPLNFRIEYLDYRGVFRPSTGYWYIHVGSGWGGQFGQDGDIPVPADYDGDGNDDIAIFRPSTGTWWLLNMVTGQNMPRPFGQAGDKPVPADYDGDGRADVAVYRPSEGMWYVLRSSDLKVRSFRWGASEDIPQPGDYDNDSRADVAVFRPSDGMWYILRSVDGTVRYIRFGQAGDISVAWIGVTE